MLFIELLETKRYYDVGFKATVFVFLRLQYTFTSCITVLVNTLALYTKLCTCCYISLVLFLVCTIIHILLYSTVDDPMAFISFIHEKVKDLPLPADLDLSAVFNTVHGQLEAMGFPGENSITKQMIQTKDVNIILSQ